MHISTLNYFMTTFSLTGGCIIGFSPVRQPLSGNNDTNGKLNKNSKFRV